MKQLNFLAVLFFMISTNLSINAQDTTPPTFQNLWIDNDTVGNSDTVEIFVNAYDSLSGIQVIQLGYRKNFNELDYSLHYPYNSYIGNNIYKCSYPISEWATSGQTIIKSIVIMDNNSNLLISETYPIDSFYVVSDSPDTVPPVLLSISVNPDTVEVGEIVTTTIEVIDDVSGFLFCNFSLVDEENNLVEWFYGNYVNGTLVQIEPNKYSLDIAIPSYTYCGNHHFKIGLFDRQNNGIEYNIQDSNTVFFVNSNLTTYVSPIQKGENFKIYPSPTNGLINVVDINQKEAEISIISMDGRIINYGICKGNTILDISNLTNGIYEIIIRCDGQKFSKRIVKKPYNISTF